ncbi:phosphoribosylanthranilate isomerase [Rhodococcus sp. HNM0569]|uniref:phosphoribosylanthranilate isomerase n=1 Tax=Rhodococcus sp. HNM0569 TaxID=2716340 RepID=UPI00146D19CF|nr:phosphoribosylanthranilate isomerase [Rhodococcus sp. HNM0569]
MTFIKICGLRDRESVDAAVALEVDAVGFVFAASARRIDPGDAAELVAALPERTRAVGVFKGSGVDEIVAVASRAGIRTVQVHDLTGRTDVARLHDAGFDVVRAVVAHSPDAHDAFGADELLIDGAVAGAGRTWDWSSGAPTGRRWIVAGGLDADNVAAALDATGAWGVDVSSGVESARGVKDVALIEKFVAAVRSR